MTPLGLVVVSARGIFWPVPVGVDRVLGLKRGRSHLSDLDGDPLSGSADQWGIHLEGYFQGLALEIVRRPLPPQADQQFRAIFSRRGLVEAVQKARELGIIP